MWILGELGGVQNRLGGGSEPSRWNFGWRDAHLYVFYGAAPDGKRRVIGALDDESPAGAESVADVGCLSCSTLRLPLSRVVGDAKHPEHGEAVEWLEFVTRKKVSECNPSAFDSAEVNGQLRDWPEDCGLRQSHMKTGRPCSLLSFGC